MLKQSLIFFSFFLGIVPNLRGQENASSADNAIRLDHIAVYVHELDTSTRFYQSILRLEEIPEPFHDGRHTWFSIGSAGQLHLIQGAEAGADRDKNDHLCFSVSSVDRFVQRLEEYDVPYFDWPGTPQSVTTRVDGVKQVYFQDPDGHWIEINDAQP